MVPVGSPRLGADGAWKAVDDFQGIRWEKDEDKDRPGWRCYCAKPTYMYDQRGDKVKSDPQRVFLVFIDEEGVAYNWRWDWADANDSETPEGHARFVAKVFDQRDAARERGDDSRKGTDET